MLILLINIVNSCLRFLKRPLILIFVIAIQNHSPFPAFSDAIGRPSTNKPIIKPMLKSKIDVGIMD